MKTPPLHRHRGSNRGFSLLEVMVAIAILGLGLTAILSAQAGSFAAATQARSMSVATGLARCKMLELEQKVLKDGFPEMDQDDSGPCCDGDDREVMRCTWRIEKPVLPEPGLGQLDLNAGLSLGSSSGASGGPGGLSGLAGLASGMSQSGAGSAMGLPSGGAKAGDLASGMVGMLGSAGGIDGIVGMLMSLVYPTLKKYFEAGTRRLVVTVHWADGNRDRTLEIMQWYTAANAPPPAASASASGSSSPGAPPLLPGGSSR